MMAKNNFTNKLNSYGITPGQFAVLKVIFNHNGNTADIGLSPACIADRIECDRPTVSGIVDRLEAQEWIVRMQNPEDKRSCIIQLADKAKDCLKELDEIHDENQQIILNGFTKEETIMFKKFLLQVLNNFKETEQ
jgi:MarR family transcriptional regulator for hemolysin